MPSDPTNSPKRTRSYAALGTIFLDWFLAVRMNYIVVLLSRGTRFFITLEFFNVLPSLRRYHAMTDPVALVLTLTLGISLALCPGATNVSRFQCITIHHHDSKAT